MKPQISVHKRTNQTVTRKPKTAYEKLIRNLCKSYGAFRNPNPHAFLHMTEPVAAQMLAAIPARDHHNLADNRVAFQHPQDHHARAAFPVIGL